jgi:hypothetical protein
MPTYTVKNIKSFMGLDFPGYNATLYCDGKAVAEVIQDGGGGPTDISWKDHKSPRVNVPWKNSKDEDFTMPCTPEEAKLYEHIRGKAWTFEEMDNKVFQHDPETFLGEIIEDAIAAKAVVATHKRWIKTLVCVKMKDTPEGSFTTFKTTFTKKAKDFIVNKYGDKIEYFLNEKYGQNAL